MDTKFWSGDLKGRAHLVDTDVDGDNIKMGLKELGQEDVDWSHVTQARN
jgi:hypothetical protein